MRGHDYMATGFLKVIVSTASGVIPIGGARVTILYGEIVLYELATDENGSTAPIPLETPPVDFSLIPTDEAPYATYTVKTTAEGFGAVTVYGVEILGGETSLLPVNMVPGDESVEITIPTHELAVKQTQVNNVDVTPMGFFH